MTDRNPDPNVDPNIDTENPDDSADQLEAAEEAVTSEDITDTEFGEDPDIEVPDTDA